MKRNLTVWQISGFIFTGVLGVILHFVFDWTNHSVIVTPFVPVNESVWEHLKLLFYPMLVFSYIQSRYIGKEYEIFWCVKRTGILFGMLLVPLLFYTINAIFKSVPDWVNILIFFVSVAGTYYLEVRLFNNKLNCNKSSAIVVLTIMFVLFVLFTFFTPDIDLFKDPITGTYGYPGI